MPSSQFNTLLDRFKWFFGVIEDRNDPLKLGRVRARFFGVHSDDKSKVPTESLPWAIPVNPLSFGSTSGVGGPITGAVEGTWVIGFFADQESHQKPFILGSISSLPTTEADTSRGFNDPNGKFPRTSTSGLNNINESDVSRLARGDAAETHLTLKEKRKAKVTGIPKARAASIKIVQADKDALPYKDETFDEPNPRGHDGSAKGADYSSKYPHNQVTEYESGHVIEVDNSPGAERFNYQHRSGTYEEIVADGSRSIKIVGNDFEAIIQNKQMYIKGNLDITVEGDMRTLVKGNMITEVEKDHVTLVHGDKIEKIQGNYASEILTDSSTQINGNRYARISKNDALTVQGSETISIGGAKSETIVGEETKTNISPFKQTLPANCTILAKGNFDIAAVGNLNLASASKINLKSKKDMSLTSEANQAFTVTGSQTMAITGSQGITASVSNINNNVNITGTSTASVDHVSAGISGKGHKHGGVAAGSAKTGVPE